MIKSIFKYIAIAIGVLLALVILFVLASVTPIDHTPYQQRPAYTVMQKNLQTLDTFSIPTPVHGFYTGFAKENITPPFVTSMAGVGLRKKAYTSVHDSLYVRCIVVDNGTKPIALVSLDMLILPPKLREALALQLPAIGFSLDNTYLSVTHTHNSIGNWGEHLVGELYTGAYNQTLIDFLCAKVVASITSAAKNKLSSTIKIGAVPVSDLLFNRLADEQGTVDSLLHTIEINRSDSTKLLLASFTGHATCAPNVAILSRDYPGVFVDKVEASGYSFAMFMAGAVGSHGCSSKGGGWEGVTNVGNYVADTFLKNKNTLHAMTDSSLAMVRVPMALGEPQLKLTQDWRVRPWLFNSFLGNYPASLTGLRFGNQLMLGAPCDFSGELTTPFYTRASAKGFDAMITSFNGSYVGYITLDKHYDIDHYETRIMNWYGPGNGAYFSESMLVVMDALMK